MLLIINALGSWDGDDQLKSIVITIMDLSIVFPIKYFIEVFLYFIIVCHNFGHMNEFLFFRFMRSVAYRQFIHLVYEHVGKHRIPLPACAYHAIRSNFQPKDSNEYFVGFQDEDMDN